MRNTLLAVLVALLVGAGGGAWVGHGLASGDCAREQLDGTAQALQATAGVVEAGRESVRGLVAESAEAGQRAAAVAARQIKERVVYETLIQKVPVGADCRRDVESFGLLVGAIRTANAGTHPDLAGGLPGAVRSDSGAGGPGGPGSATLGAGGGAVP